MELSRRESGGVYDVESLRGVIVKLEKENVELKVGI